MKRTDFGNAAILRWLSYFSEYDELDLATLLILDITRQNKNLIPAVQSTRQVMVLTDRPHQARQAAGHDRPGYQCPRRYADYQ